MSYDEIDIEDMEWSEGLQAFTYQCPCGDLFQISMRCRSPRNDFSHPCFKQRLAITDAEKELQEELAAGEEIAHCPSCSLIITVIYDLEDFKAKDDGDPQLPQAAVPVA